MKKIKLKVKGMHCKSCEMLIGDSLEDTGKVKNFKASHTKGEVELEYDEKGINEATIKSIIKKEGYEVE